MVVRKTAVITQARNEFHKGLLDSGLLIIDKKTRVPTFADKDSPPSVGIAKEVFQRLGGRRVDNRLKAQSAGKVFENLIEKFLAETFLSLTTIRPGDFTIRRGGGIAAISDCDQYQHLAAVAKVAAENPAIAIALGEDYIVMPDVMILRSPVPDVTINKEKTIVDETTARKSSIRKVNNEKPILHANISCKWTLRSDRAQNSRFEALNLIRNRKGKLPHIAVVTAEPLPSRLASIALGTGDIDYVYHIALEELAEAIDTAGYEDAKELLNMMIEGNRLRDISDLPLDMAI